MASWASNQPVALNPYIQQTPVDAYTNVERIKQQQYDTNTAAIDNVFSTLINLPVDSKYSEYVNSSVSQLSASVKKIAGSDFSNRQLVSKIDGAASQIAKDPIVQAGIISASNMKYNMDIMKEDRKSGKLTPDNEYDYMDEYNKWKANPDLSSPFAYNYSTNIDINKKWLDVLKSINSSANLTDIPFETDATGHVDYNKIATVMTERGYKGVSPDQLKAAVQSSLSEADMNQLRISAKYRFRSYSPDDLVRMSDVKYQSQRTELLAKKEQLEGQLKLYPETTALGAKMKNSLDYIDSQLGTTNQKGKLDINRENEAAWIRSNPDGAKTEIYKNGYIDQFSKAFSYMDESTKYVESPYTKYDQWMKGYAMDVQKYNLDVNKFQHTMDQDAISNELERLKIAQKDKELKGTGIQFTTAAGIDTKGVLTQTPIQTLTGVGETYRQQANVLTDDLVDRVRGAGESENAARANVNKMITDYQSGNLNKMYKDLEPQIKSIIRANSNMANVASYLQGVQKDVDSAYSKSPEYQQAQAQINSRHPLKLGGYTFSPNEILSYLSKEDMISASGGTGGASTYRSIDQNSLSAKERVLFNRLGGTRYGISNQKPDSDQSLINKYLGDYGDMLNINRGQIAKRNDLTNQYLQNSTPVLTPDFQTISMPKTEDRNMKFQEVSTILNRIGTDKGGNDGLDIDEAHDMIDGKNNQNTKISIYRQPGNNQLVLTNGEKKQIIKLTPEEAVNFSPELGKMNNDLAIMLGIGKRTTNFLGKPEGAYFQRTDFPSVKKLNVTADLHPIPSSQDANGNPMFYIEYNTQIDGKWRKLQLDVPLTLDQVNANLQQVNDQVLLDAYSKDK